MGVFGLFLSLSALLPMHADAATVSKSLTNLGIVGWWPLNEGTSTVAHDISGYGNNGTLTNMESATDWVAGKRGKALDFDGSNDYIDAGASVALSNNSPFSYSIWFKLAASQQSKTIMGKHNDATGGASIGIDDSVANKLKFHLNSYASQRVNSTATFDDGGWHHAVGTWDGDILRLYVDGVLDVSSDVANTLTFPAVNFQIGRWVGGSSQYFNGRLDDARIYSRALSIAEVQTLYRAGETLRKTVTQNGLVGQWTMDEGTSTIAHDFSGNGANATFSGAPLWVPGKKAFALDFDGVDDYLITPLSRSSYSSMTAAVWIKYEGSVSDSYRAVFAGQSADFFVGKNTGNSNIGVQDGGYNGSVAVGTNAWDGNWHHIAYVFSGGTGTIYLDGYSVGSAAFAGGTGAIWIAQENEGAGYDFNGKIDDARVYNRALSATEITALYRENMTLQNHSQSDKLTNGLVGMWSFNGADTNWTSGSAGIAYDRSGNSNDGTLTGMTQAASPASGRVGQALSFDGSTSLITVPYSATLAPTSGVSFGGWFKTTNKNLAQRMVSKTETGGYTLAFNEGSNCTDLCMLVRVGGAYHAATTSLSNITNNKWHHVMATYDGETARMYFDGALSGSNTNPSGVIQYSSTNPLCIGREPSGAACDQFTDFFNGSLDEIRVYNRAITAAEVKQLYLMGK